MRRGYTGEAISRKNFVARTGFTTGGWQCTVQLRQSGTPAEQAVAHHPGSCLGRVVSRGPGVDTTSIRRSSTARRSNKLACRLRPSRALDRARGVPPSAVIWGYPSTLSPREFSNSGHFRRRLQPVAHQVDVDKAVAVAFNQRCSGFPAPPGGSATLYLTPPFEDSICREPRALPARPNCTD